MKIIFIKKKIFLLSISLFLSLICLVKSTTSATYAGICTADSDCPSGTYCISVKISPTVTYKKCTPSPVCRDNTAGACPSYNPNYLNAMCVFVNTTKLRDVTCCTTLNVPSGCVQCFRNATNYYAGSYQCIPVDQCSKLSTFKDACSTSTDCYVDNNNLCNKQGTCYPKDPDNPGGTFECLCYNGFSGGQCQVVNTTSSYCLIDCGKGGTQGTCLQNSCVCKTGWTGSQCLQCSSRSTCNLNSSGSSSGSKTCSSTCGTNGQCQSGSCTCRLGCVGTQCTACETNECLNCAFAQNIHHNLFFNWFTLCFSISIIAFNRF